MPCRRSDLSSLPQSVRITAPQRGQIPSHVIVLPVPPMLLFSRWFLLSLNHTSSARPSTCSTTALPHTHHLIIIEASCLLISFTCYYFICVFFFCYLFYFWPRVQRVKLNILQLFLLLFDCQYLPHHFSAPMTFPLLLGNHSDVFYVTFLYM